jgi:tetratricopeptide (TPR) repeat protein|tara:strand:- start:3394 stop:3762 length:369 start_codon:yes stop_codon:yes gene_type:complete
MSDEINAKLSQAETLKDDGKIDEAITLLLEILEEAPQHTICHFTLAVLYGRIDQHAKAVEHGETAVQLEPMDPFSYTAMSVTYQRAYAGTDDHSYIAKAEDAMEKSRQVAQQQQIPGQGPSC